MIKTLSLPLILIFAVLLSCQTETTTAIESTAYPELIQRSEKIQHGKEWDYVQNIYSEKINQLKKDPSNAEAKLVLAQLYIKEARVTGEHGHYYPAALTMIEKVLNSDEELEPTIKFQALMHKAGVQLSLHEFADALKTGQQAILINPRNAQIHGVLVDAYVELGQYDKAILLADKMVSMKPDLRSYSRISYLREIHGDIDGAIDAMTLAVEAGYPGYEETAWAMLTLAELYHRYGQADKAEKIYEGILEMRNDYPFAVAALGDLQYENGDLEKAQQTLNEAIEIIPEVGFYISLAHIYKDQNRTEDLEDIKKEILVMLEDDVANGHNMNLEYTNLYLELFEEPETALSYIEKEYKKRPDNIDVNLLMAKVYRSLNDTSKLKMYADAAAVTKSVHPDLVQIQGSLN